MSTTRGATTVATATDLCERGDELLDRAAAGENVVVHRDAEPLCVLIAYDAFQKLMDVAERLEDLEDLLLARERERAVRRGEDRLVPIEEVMRDLGMQPDSRHSA